MLIVLVLMAYTVISIPLRSDYNKAALKSEKVYENISIPLRSDYN